MFSNIHLESGPFKAVNSCPELPHASPEPRLSWPANLRAFEAALCTRPRKKTPPALVIADENLRKCKNQGRQRSSVGSAVTANERRLRQPSEHAERLDASQMMGA
jgi:hypothetical protein